MQTIGLAELLALLNVGAPTLIEALPAAHFDAGHLPGALNVPGNLTADLAGWLVPNRSTTVVVYCSGLGCNRSRVTAAAFIRLGYTDVRLYPGGKSDWVAAGLPVEPTDAKRVEAAA